MKELLKRTKANMILMAILTILLGLILIIWPASSTMFICLVAGWLLLLGGILSVVIYFSSREAGPSSALFLGLVAAALGLWIVIRPSAMMQFISVLFGIILLLHGFMDIQDSIELKRGAYNSWWIFMLFSVLTVMLGVFVIWAPITSAAVMTIFSGISLLFDGITELILVFRVSKMAKQLNAYGKDYTTF